MTNQLTRCPVDFGPLELIQQLTGKVENSRTDHQADVDTLTAVDIAFHERPPREPHPTCCAHSPAIAREIAVGRIAPRWVRPRHPPPGGPAITSGGRRARGVRASHYFFVMSVDARSGGRRT